LGRQRQGGGGIKFLAFRNVKDFGGWQEKSQCQSV